jgi:TctA family transporter
LVAACLGLGFSTMGYDPVTGSVRYTFGSDYLWDGIRLVPAFIGLFCISEALDLFLKRGRIAQLDYSRKIVDVTKGIMAVFGHFWLFLRCSIIGCVVGIIPGVGGAVTNFLAYGHAVQSSKNPETYGKGDIRGVIAPEAANDSKDGGALVPTLLFGIPGSLEMAVFLGALIVLGLEPGPRMMMDNPQIILVLIYTLVAGNILVAVLGILGAGVLVKITYVPTTLLAPIIFMLGLMGAFLTHGMLADVVLSLVFGVIAFAMKRFGFSRIAVVIALVLGKLAQKTFHQTLMLWGVKGFFIRPIALGLFLITAVMLLFPYIRTLRRPQKAPG